MTAVPRPRPLPALSSSLEDYVEAVFVLGGERGEARVSEIARLLDVRLPSVSRALRRLKELGLVECERYGAACLSPSGAAVARTMVDRHATLVAFLTEVLGLPPTTAEQDACPCRQYACPLPYSRHSNYSTNAHCDPALHVLSARRRSKDYART